MSGAHIHLMFNHVPLLGLFLGVAVLALGTWRKNAEWQKVALGLVLFAGLGVVPTYFSGEEAEEVVEHMPGVSEAFIEEHEDAALPAAVVTGAAAAVAAAALWTAARGAALPPWGAPGVLGLGFIALLLIARAANFGGRINHPEIRDGTAVMAGQEDEHEQDDDD